VFKQVAGVDQSSENEIKIDMKLPLSLVSGLYNSECLMTLTAIVFDL